MKCRHTLYYIIEMLHIVKRKELDIDGYIAKKWI